MSVRRQSRLPARALLAVMIVTPMALLSSLPWLKQQSQGMAYLAAGIASTLTVLSSLALSVLHDRRLDEWHRSAARFSSQWGWTTGACLVALLLALPPFQDLVVSWAPPAHREMVLLAFVSGFMAVVAAQLVCTALLGVGWTYWMSRSPREAHEEQD